MVKQERRESWLLGNERGSLRGPCDRWRGWLGEAGCGWSGQLCLTVACCFSALSFASSSCFCKAAWRDFISSLSSEREVRNTLLAHPPYTVRAPLSPCTTTGWLSLIYRCWEPFCRESDFLKVFFTLLPEERNSNGHVSHLLRWVNQVHTVCE